MTPADQIKLCSLLNTDASRIRWEPDPGAIGGGILARLGNVGQLWARRAVRPTYAILTLQLRLFGIEPPRPTRVAEENALKGRGWHARAAEAIRATLPSVVAAYLQTMDKEFDAVLAEPETQERAKKLCALEVRRTALANCVGAC